LVISATASIFWASKSVTAAFWVLYKV
jgi:hypothetical protein